MPPAERAPFGLEPVQPAFDRATRLAVVDRLAQAANNGCVVKDRRFVGSAKDGSDYFEASCQDGKGYIFKATGGQFVQAVGCGQAQGLLGGCTLTDARQATAEQAALYTKLARAAGSNCDVDHYALFPMQGNTEVVELACKDGSGAIGRAGAACSTGAPPIPCTTDPPPDRPNIASTAAPRMNSVASTVVARVSTVAPARAPKAVWLLAPPNAAAMSPPLPCWSNTTTSSRKQTST